MKRRAGLSIIASFCCLIGLVSVFNANNTYATSSTLTLSITDNVAVNLIPTGNGTFATSDTSTPNISVTTNHAAGYTLGIKAATEGANSLVNTTDSNKTIPSISSSSFPSGVSESDYADDTYASTNNLNNTWGYRPSKLNSTANSNYIEAPTSSTNETILDQTSTSNPSTANTYNVAIGARIDSNTAVGSYAATFIITAVVNPITYSITYNDNSSSAGTGFPANVVDQTTMDPAIQLSSTEPTRNRYDFAGWCTVNTADNGTCSGTTYQAGDNWTLDQTTNPNSLTLYAMWNIRTHNLAIVFANSGVSSVKVCSVSGDCTGNNLKGTVSTSGDSVSGLVESTYYYLYPSFSNNYELDNWANTGSYGSLGSTSATNPIFTIGAGDGEVSITTHSCQSTVTGSMQDFKPCKNVPIGTSGTLSDSRDSESYLVTKLADGKWWMLDNLRLDLTNSTVLNGLSTSNTNVDSTSLTSLKSGNRSAGTRYATAGVSNWTSGSGSYSQPLVNVASKNNTTTSYGAGSGKIGVYYNYCAASAGYYCFGDGTSSGSSYGNAEYDICPANWHMPSRVAYGDYDGLYSAYNSNAANFRNALSTPLSGEFMYGSAYEQGSGGYFWSSTRQNNTVMNVLIVDSDDVFLNSSTNNSFGLPVRCILKT